MRKNELCPDCGTELVMDWCPDCVPDPEPEPIKIEKGVPIPASVKGSKYDVLPIADLKPGESFFVPLANFPKKHAADLAAAIRGYLLKRFDTKLYVIRSLPVEKGVRVWRVVDPPEPPPNRAR